MKLKTKLLPLVGIAATAAVVTPLVTSCKLSKLDIVDITKGYTPTTKSSVAGELTQQEATQTYINDVKTNSEIFRQDFIYGVYNKVIKNKNYFLNLPNVSKYVTTANFKLTSLKAGVSTPTFGSTTIMYPGEPSVTYPTVSFEYNVQVQYTYEYLGAMQRTISPINPNRSIDEYDEGDTGYHARTVTLESNIKYTNVPFLAYAHVDETGKNTYWQVTPIDYLTIYAEEDNVPHVHYYDQSYIFEYMTDDWSIDTNTNVTINEKFVGTKGDTYEQTTTPSFSKTVSTWDDLSDFTRSSSTKTNYAYDYANYYDMMISFANFGFESYYLSSVAQKPEIQSTGYAQGFGSITDKTASFGAFYLPQSFDGTVKIFSGFAEDGKTPYGAIVLNNKETATPITYTIGDAEKPEEGAVLTQGTEEYKYQYGVDDQTLTWDDETTVEEGTYNFILPKTVVAQFVPTTGESWTQVVYINQDSLPIYLK